MPSSNNKQSLPTQFPVPRNSNQSQNKGSASVGSSSTSRQGSRLGGSSSSRFSSSRFGTREDVQWTITPTRKIAVRITLQGLGDPLHRILGTPLNPDLSDPANVIETLSSDTDLVSKLAELLDEAWQSYGFRGAALLYPWDENIRDAFVGEVQPSPAPPPKPENDNNDDDYAEDDDYYADENNALDWLGSKTAKRVHALRAIDAAFVMNILARARANVVVGNTPLALEPGFLEKTVICDDPRIVKIAQATGCIDEDW